MTSEAGRSCEAMPEETVSRTHDRKEDGAYRSATTAGARRAGPARRERQLLSSREHLARCRVVAGEDLAGAVLPEHHLLGPVARPHVDVVTLGIALGADGPPIVGDRPDVVGRHAQLVECGGGLRIALVRSKALHGC